MAKLDRRTHVIKLRATTVERDLFARAAEAAHLDLSTWLRVLAHREVEQRGRTPARGRRRRAR